MSGDRRTTGRRRGGRGAACRKTSRRTRQAKTTRAGKARGSGPGPRGGPAAGVGLVVEIVCQQADGRRRRTRRRRVGRQGATAAVWRDVDEARLAELAGGFAHPQRVALARLLMTGASSYHQLRTALGLKPGPVYHHIKQLRLCGLLEVGGRDVYRLTERGRLAAGVLCGLERLLAGVG